MYSYETLLKQISLQAEYDPDYSKKCTHLRLSLENAIQFANGEMLQQLSEDATKISDLYVRFSEDIDLLKLYIASSITIYVSTSIKSGLPKDIAESSKMKYFTKIAYSKTKNEIIEYYFKFIEECLKNINQFSIKNYTQNVKMAIEYIHNNKYRFIYAKDVADNLHLNRSYLAKIFKKEVGQTLTEYIHKIKMELAIELMETNLYKYSEIAELLGYTNYSYFSTVFKKFYSLSPQEYSYL